MKVRIDKTQIRKTLALLKPDHQLFEVRIISNENKPPRSGYFRDADTAINELERIQSSLDNSNVYMTLNTLNDGCYSRLQRDKIIVVKNSTSKDDVVGIDWLPIDLDPKRPSGSSSTEEQVQKAKELGNKIYNFMMNLGFEKPVIAFSGNGVHLLYKVRLANNPENNALIVRCIKALHVLFSTEEVDIDQKLSDPSRVCKLYGTLAQKGLDLPEYPHRMSYIIGDYDNVIPTDRKYLEKLADKFPQEQEKPQRYNNYDPQTFDLDSWLDKYGIGYKKTDFRDGDKYVLDCCPFNSDHKGRDAVIIRNRNGAIGFNCFHNSCADKKWQDVRKLFEPDAYEKKQFEREQRMYGRFNRDRTAYVEPKHIEVKENKPVFETALDILNKPEEEMTFIRTGTTVIDRKMRGLAKGNVSLISGVRASGKSSIISQWILEAVDAGNNVACYSGELKDKRFMRWLNQQAAGKNGVEPSRYEDFYNVPLLTQKKIADWLGDRFWLYDNEYGNDFLAVIEQFEKVIVEKKLDLLVLDNLMAFDLRAVSENKWDAQTTFVLKLVEIAHKYNVHILFVAHPKKTINFLRLDDVSGSADLANAVDNAFIVHRNNHDFQAKTKLEFGWHDDDPIYSSTNVIEIAKDRDGGTQDEFVPLWYEKESKRLKNDFAENRIYGWAKDELGFLPINMEIEESEIPFRP